MDLRNKRPFEYFREPILRALFVCLLLVFLVQSYQWHENVNKVPPGIKGKAMLFHEEMDSNMRISFVDTTEEYIYFAYSTIGVVAIYNKSGEYLCSYSFFSDTNGGLQIRCHEEILYVSDHANYEFVFYGTEMQEIRLPSEKEYTYGWFAEKRNLDIVIDNGQMYDEDGNYIMALPGRLS